MEDQVEDIETPTEVAVPTPTEVVEAPRTEAAAEATPAQEPAPEAEATETKLEAPEPPPGPIDPRDELEHERFGPVLERRDRRIETGIREDYQRQYEEATADWKSTQAYEQLAGIYGTLVEKLSEGDTEVAGRMVGRLEEAAKPFTEGFQEKYRKEGSSKAATELYGAVVGSLDHRGQDDLQDYLSQSRNAGWGDILKKRDEIRDGKSKQSNSDEITSLQAQIEDLKAKARPPGADTTQPVGADGRTDEELQLDPNTSVEKLLEIKARREAG